MAQRNSKNSGGRANASPPVHTIRFGSVKAVIWENQTQHGLMHNVTVARAYKDDKDQWQESSSFGVDDLLVLAKALNAAHSWIHEQRRQRDGDQQAA